MEGQRSLSFFLIVLFFAGSVVILAAHELRQKQRKLSGGGTEEDARRFIHALQGEVLSRSKNETFVDPNTVPDRKPGQLLHSEDKKRLSHFLGGMMPSENSE